MSKKKNLRFVMIGAGNVAVHLAPALVNAGHVPLQVYSQTLPVAKSLAEKIGTAYTNKLSKVDRSADIYIIALKDSAIADVVSEIPFGDRLVVHTSGSIDILVFKNHALNYGVLYPLQTFSKSAAIEFRNVPVCFEASNTKTEKLLSGLAKQISDMTVPLDSEQRKQVHLAAVFACNFTNHMFALAYDLLKDKNIPSDIIKPLILETAKKAVGNSPIMVQTGPAIRKDRLIMRGHLALLWDKPGLQILYKLISDSISRSSSR